MRIFEILRIFEIFEICEKLGFSKKSFRRANSRVLELLFLIEAPEFFKRGSSSPEGDWTALEGTDVRF